MSHTRAKPDKPWKDFPLFAHAGGTWAKKIGGKHKHFGPWDDPKGAYERYQDFQGTARLGAKPRSKTRAIDVQRLVNEYMTRQNSRVAEHSITLRTFKDCEQVTTNFAEDVGGNRSAAGLTPHDFTGYAKRMGKLGAFAFNRHVAIIRGMFKWAYNGGLIDQPARYGPEFSVRPESAKRRESLEREKTHGKRLFTADEIHRLLDNATGPLRAMILLAINCGLGNTDIARLGASHIDYKASMIDFARVKTGIARRCPLWPETVKAIKEWMKVRPRAKNPGDDKLIFITAFGVPFVRETSEVIDGVYQKPVVIDSVGLIFTKLAKSLGITGRSFYTLRANFRTWGDEAGKERAIGLMMGHTIQGAKRSYIRDVPDDDLRIVSNHVRAKLFRRSRAARQKSITRPSRGRSGS